MTQQLKRNNRTMLRAAEACNRAGFSRQHMQRLLKKESIEGEKIGRDWFVYEDSLQAFLAQPRKTGPKGPRKKQPVQEVPETTDTLLADKEQENTANKS